MEISPVGPLSPFKWARLAKFMEPFGLNRRSQSSEFLALVVYRASQVYHSSRRIRVIIMFSRLVVDLLAFANQPDHLRLHRGMVNNSTCPEFSNGSSDE